MDCLSWGCVSCTFGVVLVGGHKGMYSGWIGGGGSTTSIKDIDGSGSIGSGAFVYLGLDVVVRFFGGDISSGGSGAVDSVRMVLFRLDVVDRAVYECDEDDDDGSDDGSSVGSLFGALVCSWFTICCSVVVKAWFDVVMLVSMLLRRFELVR